MYNAVGKCIYVIFEDKVQYQIYQSKWIPHVRKKLGMYMYKKVFGLFIHWVEDVKMLSKYFSGLSLPFTTLSDILSDHRTKG